MTKKKVLLIINPVAGKKRSQSLLFRMIDILSQNGCDVTVYPTTRRGEADEAARKHGKDYDLVACCGGDGTLNEVLNGMSAWQHPVQLGYIPAGSTNDFARSAQLPTRFFDAVLAVTRDREKTLDLGFFDQTRRFSYIASFGAFTATSYSVKQSTKNRLGHLAYVLAGVKEFFSLKSQHVRVEADGNVYENDYLFGAVCNSLSVAGLVKLDPSLVDMNDGKFEVILVKKPKSVTDVMNIVRSIRSSDFENDMFEFFKASQITFTTQEEMDWSLDGEHQQGRCCVTVENIPDALKLKY